jgi:hypothetical protein
MAPVFLVLTTGKWAIEGDVLKREFFKKSIAEKTWEKEVFENVWIDDWSTSDVCSLSLKTNLNFSGTRNKDKDQHAGWTVKWWIKILSLSW